MPENNTEIMIDGVNVILVRKRIKHSYLRLKDDGSVLMTVNHRLNQSQIQTILNTHLPKLKPKINQLKLSQAKQLEPINQVKFLGDSVPLELIYSSLDEGNTYNSNLIQHKINLWYKKQARKVFTERFELGLSHIHSWNVSAPRLCIRDMKTRWGSYSRSTHRVCLSLWLIKMPLELIDYVIAHELTHIIHFNHSQDFYSLLATLCPEWRQKRTALRHLAQ